MTWLSVHCWLIASLAWPIGLAVLAFGVGRRAVAWVTWGAVVGMPVIAIGLVHAVVTGGAVRYAVGGWDRPLGIELHVDIVSALMLLMTSIVGAVTCVYAAAYLHKEPRKANESDDAKATTFWSLWLLLWGSLNALFVSGDAFNLYVTLELATLASVGLVTLGGGVAALKAAFRYLVLALAGSLVYLVGVSLLYAAHGTLDLGLLAQRIEPGALTNTAAAAMTLGLILKAALFPLHFWLPAAHGSAPAPVSAVLSALVVKASFYLVLRLWIDVFPASVTVTSGHVLSALGGAAVIWGSLQALRTPRLKLLVAYSTVAQLGYLFLVLPLVLDASTAVLTGVICFALAHAFAKASAFMAAGSVMHSVGHDRIADLRGVGMTLPVAVFAFAIAGVSLMGLPPSGGFAAKWLLLNGAIASQHWLVVGVMLLGGLLAAGYIFRVIRVSFLTEGEPQPAPERALQWSAMALAVAALALGFLVDPMAAWIEAGTAADVVATQGVTP